MKCLVVEDDFISRRILISLLSPYFGCDVAVDGEEAVHAFTMSMKSGDRYELVCLDIIMPKMDGQQALKRLRELEREYGIGPSQASKVIMTTAVEDPKAVLGAFYKGGATAYLVKPISKVKLLAELGSLRLLGAGEIAAQL
jgi:two-component system chemotaxis response regulator CheY